MKRSRFTEQQIAFALKQAELGTPVEEVCRKIGINDATFYNWKKKYGGLGSSEWCRLRKLEQTKKRAAHACDLHGSKNPMPTSVFWFGVLVPGSPRKSFRIVLPSPFVSTAIPE